MEIINWDGALIGPGSEWFWSMAQFAVVTITLVGIYRQLRAQASANALQLRDSMDQQWESDRMLHSRLQVALAIRPQAEFDAIYPFLTGITQFFNDLEALREDGRITADWVRDNWGRTINFWWHILAPTIEQGRISHQPTGNTAFEALNRLMREMDIKEGDKPFEPSVEFINHRLDAMIAQMTAHLRMEQEAASGLLPTVPAVAAQPFFGGRAIRRLQLGLAHARLHPLGLKRACVWLYRPLSATKPDPRRPGFVLRLRW